MKKLTKILFVLIVLLSATSKIHAEDLSVALTIRDGETIVFTGDIPLSENNTVLSVLESADELSEDFEISNIEEFPFGKYLKCIDYAGGERCDNWQYVVDGTSPFSSIDQTTISGGENIYVYFGPQNRISLNSNSIDINSSLTATTEKYDYENDSWETRTGVTVGVTQPNPSDPFNPTEILTSEVDSNGQTVFSTIPVGEYNVGVKEDYYFPTEPLVVSEVESSGGESSSGGSKSSTQKNTGAVLGAETKLKFDIEKAFEFLVKQQKVDGSFGEDIYTDWGAISLATSSNLGQTIKLIKHFSEAKLEGGLLTDYERRAMALMALGLNPYNIYPSDVANGENYIKKITDSFDGKQFGDIKEDNDDIFALIVLQNAGFGAEEKMMKDTVDFVLSMQKENGSWNKSVDMTGAGIQALSSFSLNEKVKLSLEKAKGFLQKNQKDDGGFGNVSSTTWAIGGILALGEKPEDWKRKDATPLDYLAVNQDIDGAMKNAITEEDQKIKSKIWETAYATVAYSGKTWNDIVQNFEKPADFETISGTDNNVVKVSAIVAPKKITPKKEIPAAPVLNTPEIESIPSPEPEPEKENWFMKFINYIF